MKPSPRLTEPVMDMSVPARDRPARLQPSQTSPEASSAKLPGRRRWRACGDESGFTLVEVLVTVVIMGIAVVALLGGLLNAVSSSDLHRRDTVIDTNLRSYAEGIKSSVQQRCLQGLATFTATSTATAPYTVGISSGTTTCPATGSTSQLVVKGTAPGGTTAFLTIVVAVP